STSAALASAIALFRLLGCAGKLGTRPRDCKPAEAAKGPPAERGQRKKARSLPTGPGSFGRGCLKGLLDMLGWPILRKCEKRNDRCVKRNAGLLRWIQTIYWGRIGR